MAKACRPTPAAMLGAIAKHQPTIVYLAYPNNPTANLWDDAVIERIIEAQGAQGGLVVMDEAYQPFASKQLHRPPPPPCRMCC
jgi:histidinol-phosphate aminotransferase